ncbi:MAG: DUF4412 domain-containing protein [Bacteroidota bacterium]|nr:DUF4412 domain-containing protein [Bacteroidota bacterium]MDP4192119.1 DUF4412 domain-containing protein [Bacteroidota bacterium]MDP4195469.1 DUF4412 domain-containing protein [Bacteroidota bacterium]
MKMQKNNIFYLILFSLLSFNALIAQKNFEGVVDLKLTGEKGDNSVRYYTKGNMVKIEMGENARSDDKFKKVGTIIVKNKTLFMLMPVEKTYFERPLNLNEQVKKIEKRNDINKKLTKTGQTKDILGYKAEQWTLKDKKGELELWSTNQLGNFVSPKDLGDLNSNNIPEWLKEPLSNGFFPLLIIQHSLDGKEINKIEVTNIDPKSLNSDLFDIPSDYKELSRSGK